MNKPVGTRRLIALAAAYVVALQALLLPLAIATADPIAGNLCISEPGQQPAPASHDGACACAAGCGMPCCAQALVDTAPSSLSVKRLSVRIVASQPAFAPVLLADLRSPQNPRAPPAA